jgi:hypothetical protein
MQKRKIWCRGLGQGWLGLPFAARGPKNVGLGQKKVFWLPRTPRSHECKSLLLSCTRVVRLPLIFFARLGSRRSFLLGETVDKVTLSGPTDRPFFKGRPKICGLQSSSMVDHWYRRWVTRNRVVSERCLVTSFHSVLVRLHWVAVQKTHKAIFKDRFADVLLERVEPT